MHHLISYFLVTLLPKIIVIGSCMKIIASQRWDVFWDTV